MNKPKRQGWMTMKDGSRVPMTERQMDDILAESARQKAEDEALMPDEKSARQMMARAFHRLKDFGWHEAIYCPKDGRMFQVIEAGSSGIHMASYQGEWPDGSWWVYADGDVWPSRPCLYRLNPEIRPNPAPPLSIAATQRAPGQM